MKWSLCHQCNDGASDAGAQLWKSLVLLRQTLVFSDRNKLWNHIKNTNKHCILKFLSQEDSMDLSGTFTKHQNNNNHCTVKFLSQKNTMDLSWLFTNHQNTRNHCILKFLSQKDSTGLSGIFTRQKKKKNTKNYCILKFLSQRESSVDRGNLDQVLTNFDTVPTFIKINLQKFYVNISKLLPLNH